MAALRETVLGGHTPRPGAVDPDALVADCPLRTPCDGPAASWDDRLAAAVCEHPVTGERSAHLLVVCRTARVHDLRVGRADCPAVAAVHGASEIGAEATLLAARTVAPTRPGAPAPAALVEFGDAEPGETVALSVEWLDDAGRERTAEAAVRVAPSPGDGPLGTVVFVRRAAAALRDWATDVAGRTERGDDVVTPHTGPGPTAPALPLVVPRPHAERFAALAERPPAPLPERVGALRSLLSVLAWQPPDAGGR
ncbi:MAG: hypothetical protein ABEJ42_01625 [Halobacteriaceae archaeon]